MTKNEALKLAIDGKKVRPVQWCCATDYWFFDGIKFMFASTGKTPVETTGAAFGPLYDWEVLPEYVDFASALKAYKSGKEVKSESCESYSQKGDTLCVTLSEIEGKWQILD